jgi:transcription factor C subunit 6
VQLHKCSKIHSPNNKQYCGYINPIQNNMPMSRRSGRLTGARTRYTDDAFEAAGLSDSDASSDQPAQGAGRTRKGRQDDSDSEFDEIQDDGAHSGEEDEEEYVDQEAEDDDVVEEETGLSSASDIEEDVKRGSLTRRQLSEARRQRDEEMLAAHPDETHSRGVWAPNEHVGKIVHLKLSFGTDMRDLLAMIYTRDRWYLGLDSTMPSRNTLNQPTPDYGLGSTFGLDPADLEREATAGWDWYYDDDKGTSFRERQRVESIDEGKARQKYFIRPKKEQHKVRIGPPMEPENLQKLYTLRQNEVLDFGEAWKNVEPPLPSKNRGRKRKNAAVNDSASTNNGAEEPATNRKPARSGWIINLGGKIQSLGWAPNQEGPTQYLAVSVPISKEQEAEYPPETEPKVSPAFARSEPYPCALQIWSFEATESEGLTRTTDMTKEPRLRLALCTEWGHIRKIDWCPMPRRKREDDKDGSHDLGLVACVCGDGSTRVLDVKVNEKAKAPEFRK